MAPWSNDKTRSLQGCITGSIPAGAYTQTAARLPGGEPVPESPRNTARIVT